MGDDRRALHGRPRGRGQIDGQQLEWLVGELSAARRGVTLILAMHHPVFSADTMHGSNLALGDTLDVASRVPAACPTRCSAPTRTTTSVIAHARGRRDPLRGGRQRRLSRVARPWVRRSRYPGLVRGSVRADARGLPAPGVRVPHRELRREGATVAYNTVVRRRPVLYDSFAVSPAGLNSYVLLTRGP